MNQWVFVWAAYGVTLAGTLGVTCWAWMSMRSAEKAAQR
jgi:hypothetical protein